MTRFMDYGPDWPPAPKPAPKRKGKRTLRQRLAAWVVFYFSLWAAAAIALHILVPTGTDLNFPAPPAQRHTTDVTSSLAQHPAR